jgi:hypothetical protein
MHLNEACPISSFPYLAHFTHFKELDPEHGSGIIFPNSHHCNPRKLTNILSGGQLAIRTTGTNQPNVIFPEKKKHVGYQ